MNDWQPPSSQPIPVDPRTQETIAGTALLLLNHFCHEQTPGNRVLVGKNSYIIRENGIGNLDIEFRGSPTRTASTILQLRTSVNEVGHSTSYLTARLTAEDVAAFLQINQQLAQDQQTRSPLKTQSPSTLDRE